MNRTTLIMVVIALGSAAGAWTMRPQAIEAAQFEDTGELMFPNFTDPNVATSLDVIAWSDDDAQALRFSVKQKEGRWVVPSHNDYPADGTEQMAKAAASFIDVKKDLYYDDRVDQHGQFGVLDPEGTEGEGDEKGQRITIKDASGTVVVDVIVGREIEGRRNFYYCRKPDEKRVYGSQIELDVSTDFSDWIEKDLLKVSRDDFVRMQYDPYQIDEAQGQIINRDPIVAVVADETLTDRKEWKIDGPEAAEDAPKLNSVKVRGILTSMASIKIVGVRPRPPARSLLEAQLTLQPKGFFVTPKGELLGNEGMVQAVTDDGVVYSLFFGEVTYESGIALTAGKADADKPKDDDDGESEDESGGSGGEGEDEGDTTKRASRYMFVNVH